MVTLSDKPARERLLDAADELFYEEGVHVVGIDRVIERAGVAKATLYSAFGSKEELIRAYLERRNVERQERITKALTRFDTPRDRLLGVFDTLIETLKDPKFRGCAFYNASAESQPGGAVQEVSDRQRGWTRQLFVDLGREAGAKDPEALAQQLRLIYDGAVVTSRMDRDKSAGTAARALAQTLVDAAIA